MISTVSFESLRTTAVNSERESSEASSNEASLSQGCEYERLEMLRKIVGAAQPGVIVNINVYTEGLSSGQGSNFNMSTGADRQTTLITWRQSCIDELRA